jgi:hypothetical protein
METRYIKINAVLLLLLLSACSIIQGNKKEVPKYFNENEFVGLEQLGNGNNGIKLDYELDSSGGGTLQFRTCSDVKNAQENEVVQQQFNLLKLMKMNCKAANLYKKAPATSATYWPDKFDAKFVNDFPANTVPDLGGESMHNRNGTMGEIEPAMKIVDIGAHNFQVLLGGDLDINYVVIARCDFDRDGFEDLLLRLDWSITSAFGKGFDLVILSKTRDDRLPKISWRWGMAAKD